MRLFDVYFLYFLRGGGRGVRRGFYFIVCIFLNTFFNYDIVVFFFGGGGGEGVSNINSMPNCQIR